MKKIIDNFSTQSKIYQKYRPVYPVVLYDMVFTLVDNKQLAWDCGTGNGQVASILAKDFKQVKATDISENQLENALTKDNIHYSLQRAETTNFSNNSFDLITVGQAIHWFDFDAFFKEVKRVGKPNGIIAIFGYGLLRIEGEGINNHLDHFYTNIIGPYWNKERRFIDDGYRTIPFPFEEIRIKQSFTIDDTWTIQQLAGYLNTWSSVQRFIQKEGFNPVTPFIEQLQAVWLTTTKKIRFPILLRIGKIQ